MEAVNKAKPTGAKGIYIRRVTLTSTMAPGIRLDAMAASAYKSLNA
jgi:large subunit ribosomal protein L1